MKVSLTTILMIFSSLLFATVDAKTDSLVVNTQTRAIVVGISDYQHEGIPDLKFAHKDALAFSSWLQSAAGGHVPSDNIITMVNEQATIAKFTSAIDWLLKESQAGDKVVIYFSGHGDMEAKILNQLGFLLLWDSPAHSYLAGAMPVDILKQVITTLSISNKAKVLVIADACRAGKLAGNSIIGAQLTNANLSKQFVNEQKILSCQANEYSIEGEEWGGGRGAFSYHLINGLYGLADKNNDRAVSLLEIEHFVQDRVEEEVAPLVQVPIAFGNKQELLSATKEEAVINQILQNNKNGANSFSNIEQRGLLDDVLSQADTSIVQLYLAFTKAVNDKRFLEPQHHCADYYFEQLQAEKQIERMHQYLIRNYAAALQDDAQQAVNAFLNINVNHLSQSRINFYTTYKNYPKLLNRAAELLGENHYFYSITKAKELLFEGVVKYFKVKASEANLQEESQEAIAFFQKSLEYEDQFPATHYFMGLCLARQAKDYEKAQVHMERANELAGAWVLPYAHMATVLIKDNKDFEKAEFYLTKAQKLDSTSATVLKATAIWHFAQKRIPEAIQTLEKAAIYHPEDHYIYQLIGKMYYIKKQYNKAVEALKISIELFPDQYESYYVLGATYYSKRDYIKAEELFLKAVAYDPEKEKARKTLSFFYRGLGRYEEALAQLHELIELTEPSSEVWVDLAIIWAMQENYKKALPHLETAFQKGFDNKKLLEAATELEQLRQLEEYQLLIKKYLN